MRKSFVFIMIFLLAGIALIFFLAKGNTSEENVFSGSTYEPMNDYLARFNELFTEQPIDELIPVAEIPSEDLSWLLKDEADISLKASKGFKFANGDILIIFFYEADNSILYYVLDDFLKSPFNQGKGVQTYIEKNLGVIISSPDYGDILVKMAETAFYMQSAEE